MTSIWIFSPLTDYSRSLCAGLASINNYDVHLVVDKTSDVADFQTHHWNELVYRQLDQKSIFIYEGDQQYARSFLFSFPGILLLREFDQNAMKASILTIVHNLDIYDALRDNHVYYLPYGISKRDPDKQKRNIGISEDTLILFASDPAKIETVAHKAGIQKFRIVSEKQFLEVSDIYYSLESSMEASLTMEILEAMAMGKPVVALQNRFNAYLPDYAVLYARPTQEMEDLVRITSELWKQPDLRQQFGNRARDYVVKHHSMTKMVEAYHNVIQAYDYLRAAWKDDRSSLPQHLRPLHIRIDEAYPKIFPHGLPEIVEHKLKNL